MLFRSAAVAATSFTLALSMPTYTIPTAFSRFAAADSCTYPEGFEIQNFTTWTPAPQNNASSTIDFGFFDKSTDIQTPCHYNSTSKNVGRPGLAARYACDNQIVEFIWQNGTLTLIETACPGATGTARWEASGSVKPAVNCTATSYGYAHGGGNRCSAANANLQANFTSLQPSPPAIR